MRTDITLGSLSQHDETRKPQSELFHNICVGVRYFQFVWFDKKKIIGEGQTAT